ncbi:MAG: S8 family serine peptidase, partial [Candidatus Cloacimonetes bacterium]|nr:S8 family serine peptidase [Candidatus Cloacimonadota bacterium]
MRKMMLVLSVFVTMGMVLSAAALRETHITRPMFAEDRVKIKLTTEAMGKSTLPEGLYAESMSFGFDELDQLVSRGGGTKIVRAHRRVKDRDWETKTGFDRWFIVMLDGRQKITDVLAGFKDNPYIEDAIPEYIAHRLNVPNDPYYNMSWGHNNVAQFPAYVSNYGHIGAAVGTIGYDTNAWQAWDQTQGYGYSSIVIAIIDSGVDYEHADLAANCVAGYDYGDDDNDPMDDAPDEGHGTCCAGIAAAVANNGVGVIGVAGGCSIMPLKIADSNGDMYFTYIENAISHAADNGADVISMSLGAYIEEGDIPTTDVVIEAAYDAGVVIFAATGNYSSQSPDQDYVNYPANHTDVIAVAASSPTAQRKSYTSSDNETWWGSIYGLTSDPADDPAAVDITGPTILPATDVSGAAGYSTGDYYIWFNGTSCATPYVAGAAALVLSRTPSLTPAQVRTRLVSTATDITNEGGTGWDRYTGYGLVNVYGALGTAPAATVDSTSFYIELVTGNIGSRSLTVGNTGEMVLKYTAYREIRALDESYERVGYFPAEWTQQNVSGNTCWIFLPGAFGGSPSSAYDGTLNARLFLASTSSNATTKLISPSLDLSDATAATLTFYHAQAAWDGDQDQLKVYYRTSAGGSWTLLQTYTSDVTSWTQRTINLPNLSSDYFIAFEGITNYGHGVCIDEVVVTRQAPEPDSWLTVAGGVSSSGSIDGIAKDQDVVTIGFNATSLPPGIYSTTMYVDSNSATNPNISIPCTLKVL